MHIAWKFVKLEKSYQYRLTAKQNQEDNIWWLHFQDKRKNREHKTNAQLTQIKPDFAY